MKNSYKLQLIYLLNFPTKIQMKKEKNINNQKIIDPGTSAKNKLTGRLFEKGFIGQLPSLQKPRVFSLPKQENPLIAKVANSNRQPSNDQLKNFASELPRIDSKTIQFQNIFNESQFKTIKEHLRMKTQSENPGVKNQQNYKNRREKIHTQIVQNQFQIPPSIKKLPSRASRLKTKYQEERWLNKSTINQSQAVIHLLEKMSGGRSKILSTQLKKYQQIKQNQLEEKQQKIIAAPKDIDAFILMCKQQKLSALQFTYMIKNESNDYYNMRLISYHSISSSGIKNYFTLSAKGVTKYQNSIPVEFLSLSDWIKQRNQFNQIKQLSFFRKFRKWKSMKKWLKILSQQRFKRVTEILSQKLFILNPDYRNILVNHNSLCYEIQHFKLVELPTQSITREQFIQQQFIRRNQIVNKLKTCSNQLHQKCQLGLENIVQTLRTNIMVQLNSQQSDKKASDQKSKAFQQLGFPQNISYGHRSMMRSEFIRFLRLAYLLDFIVIQSLGILYTQNMKVFLEILTQKNTLKQNNKLIGKILNPQGPNIFKQSNQPIFTIKIKLNTEIQPQVVLQEYTFQQLKQKFNHFDFQYFLLYNQKQDDQKGKSKKQIKQQKKNIMMYEDEKIFKKRMPKNIYKLMLLNQPKKEDLISTIQQIFTEGQDCIQVVQRWSKNKSFIPYINALEEWDQIIGEKWSEPQSIYLNPSLWIRQNQTNKMFGSKIKELIQDSYQRLQKFKRQHKEMLILFWRNRNSNINELSNELLADQAVAFKEIVNCYTKLSEMLKTHLIIKVDLGLYMIDCTQLSKHLIEEQNKMFTTLCTLFLRIMKQRVSKLKGWYLNSIKSLTSMIIRIQEFVQQKYSLDSIQIILPKIKEQLQAVKIISLLIDQSMPNILKKQQKDAISEVFTLDLNLFTNINEAQAQTTKNMERFKKNLKQRLQKLLKQIDDIQQLCNHDKFKLGTTDAVQAESQLAEYEIKIKQFQVAAQKHRYYEQILEITDFANFQSLDKLKEDHRIKFFIFRGIKQIRELSKSWNQLKFKEVKVKQLATICDKYAKQILLAQRTMPQNTATPIFKRLVWLYKQAMPVIVALRSQYLQEQHWKQVKTLLNSDFDIQDQNFTLSEFLQLPVQSFQQEIIQISVRSNQQFNLKRQIQNLQIEWADIDLKLKNYKDSNDLFVLYQVDEILAKLDQGLATISNILANRYIRPIRPRAQKIYSQISTLQQIIDKWLECQKKWIYLENIFASPDLKKQLPQQSAEFVIADKFLKTLMKKTNSNPKIFRLLKIPNLHEGLIKTSQSLDHIEKQLQDYLQVKRRHFPRFYFLSNDQLLQILAKSQNLQAVEQHLNKCFEGLTKLYIQKQKSTSIEGMKSPEGQIVKFFTVVNARSNVESWLLSLQKQMIQTLRRSIRQGLKNYINGAQKTRKQWILKHKGQIVCTVSQILWCLDTEQAIKEQASKGGALSAWYAVNIKQLQVLTQMVRGQLTELYRKIIISLITTDVHNRDIVNQLNNNQVESISDNYWQQQLRYYAQQDMQGCIVKQVTATMDYGYQYLGATSRLVITPLTDRCWITITSALANQLGASPAGPAGTGKTESTKDLAKGLGRLCIVFNCSDQITATMMNKLFSGLIQQGAWTCLDQFNRIDIEVLSVIAQQILSIRIALKKRIDQFEFQGKVMTLKKTMGVFITMNPGYAGRTQLPDNLKSLFRPVSMMIPDYAMIAQIMLFAEGFQHATQLSKKMVQLYKLSSQQLSQQDHYDFGMRAVKSLLVMAGALKRSDNKQNEDVVLIRAMKDSNIPKFLKDDIPLFEALVQDLFPNVKIQEIKNNLLEQNIRSVLQKNHLQPKQGFITKIVQLFDIFNVRFGVMLVGQTGSGKSTCFKMLSQTMIKLKTKAPNDKRYQNVYYKILNPKSVSMGQLYGYVDQLTQQWVDGIASSIIRQCNTTDIQDQNYDFNRKYWVVFDGPVDALWIQNMNTVLDDNMTLCLANSQRIKLRQELRMLFEVQDLAVASPATVSRCGMVYLSSENLTWKQYVTSWFEKNCVDPSVEADVQNQHKLRISTQFQQLYKGLFKISMEKILQQKKHMFEPFPTTPIQICQNLCTMLSLFIKAKKFTNSYDQNMKRINFTFAFCLIWAAGGSIQSKHYEQFETLIRLIFPNLFFPKTETIFDFFVNPENHISFISWEQKLQQFEYSKQTPYFDLLVPTVDTTKYAFLLEKQLEIQKCTLFTGQTGVGKTVFINNLLYKLKEKNIVSIMLNCSAQTKAKDTQLAIQSKLNKKGKTLFGARPNQSIAIFIDDINMPALQFYGSQPTIQLLRQFVDQKGFYDRSKLFWKDVVDTTLIACGANPGGGRNQLSKRFLRHFMVVCMPQPSQSNLKKIFESILKGFLTSYTFVDNIKKSCQAITLATLLFYKGISSQLLPTPNKFHYTFNLRDISKVFQGILMYRPQSSNTVESIWKLWYHELWRVFGDRLIDENDRQWFKKYAASTVNRAGGNIDISLLANTITFSDILKIDASTILYEQILDLKKAVKILESKMDNYNMEKDDKLSLVFFDMAVQQILKISRILRQPRGNIMLIGVGGSGKQSLSKLASYIMGSQIFQIQMIRNYNGQSFRQDLRKLADISGCKLKSLAFIFTDLQIAYQSFLQDINNLINTGEVPNLYQKKDEIDEINNQIRPIALKNKKPDSPESLWNYFVNQIRANLHVILCMSPAGESLRIRCRKFPSLINCCTLLWFTGWPKQALYEVAKRYISNVQIQQENIKQGLSQMCMQVSLTVSEACSIYLKEQKRKVYTTPKSYLDQLELFSLLLNDKLKQINSFKIKLTEGINKLYNTNAIVGKLKQQMKKLQPVLQQQSIKTQRFLIELDIDRAKANKVEVQVEQETQITNTQANQIKIIKQQAQAQLGKALPALREAQQALNKLNKNDISEIKGFASPPAAVQMVLEAVCTLLGQKTQWNQIKLVMIDMNFLDRLKNYDKNNISDNVLKKLRVYTNKPEFDPFIVGQKNLASKSLCMWCRAVDNFSRVAKEVEPKKKKLAELQAKMQIKFKQLQAKNKQLNTVREKVAKLQKECDQTVAFKKKLEQDMDITSKRLQRAQKLTFLLAQEGVRWKQQIQQIKQVLVDVAGDIFLSACTISYAGAFTGAYRQPLMNIWYNKMKNLQIPFSKNYSLSLNLENPIRIRDWILEGLPNDSISIDNAIIVKKCQRWPLMIDPQGEANRWIKKNQKQNDLKIINFEQQYYLKTLQSAIQSGYPVLIEQIQQTLQTAIDSILQKQIMIIDNMKMIKLGDKRINYNPNFKLYMTTKMSNPHYLPEIFIKVTVINFSITFQGLQDQLLSEVMKFEKPQIQKNRDEVVVSIANSKKSLKEAQQKILQLLAKSTGMILDDVVLIQTLQKSKLGSVEIIKNLEATSLIEEKINISRNNYIPVAIRGTILYFVVTDLNGIDPMYQYSLTYFKKLFKIALHESQKNDIIELRLQNLNQKITRIIFTDISYGLFQSHKKIYAFLICAGIKKQSKLVSQVAWNLLIRGPGIPPKDYKETIPNPDPTFFSNQSWYFLTVIAQKISQITQFINFAKQNTPKIKQYFQNQNLITTPFPNKSVVITSNFTKLLIVKAIAPEKFMLHMGYYVQAQLGNYYQQIHTVSLDKIYQSGDHKTPIIFVLSQGADPTSNVLKFSQQKGKIINIISLGQGQGKKAEVLIEKSKKDGNWILLLNCHLARSWMPALEKIITLFSEQNYIENTQFRIFLTSMPANYFPVSILQNSIKLTIEPPRGLKANLKRSFQDFNQQLLESCPMKKKQWLKMLYSLVFFHATIQQRRKFGPLGFNIRYEFNESDLEISISMLKMFLNDQKQQIPWQALIYMTGHINYGGRVTDDWDRVCLLSILKKYYNTDVLTDKYMFSDSQTYFVPNCSTLEDFRLSIQVLPNQQDPIVFGLHDNANIIFMNQQSNKIIQTILALQAVSVSQSQLSPDQQVLNIIANLASLPPLFNLTVLKQHLKGEIAGQILPSMTTFLLQQVLKFNNLLNTIKNSMVQLQNAIKGLVVMSQDLDQMYTSFLNNVVPNIWRKVGYSSLKPLSSWYKDMKQRVQFIDGWYNKVTPNSYWMSGFFFPQGFLTGVLQTHARKYKIPIDTLAFKYRTTEAERDKLLAPKDGIYIYGLYLDGARWDNQHDTITDQQLTQIQCPMPIIHFLPIEQYQIPQNFYHCPCYKTSNRVGVLSTTGQSTNFILAIDLNSKYEKPEFWILRGAALICQLDN